MRLILTFGGAQDDAGGTEGKEGAVLDNTTLARLQFYVANKGAAVAVVVAEGVAQIALLVATDGERTVVEVYAGVDSFESGVDGIALLIASNDVIAHLQRDDLLVVEDVLDDYDRAAGGFISSALTIVCIHLGILFFLRAAQFGHSDADAKLLAALVALEYQRLTSRILRLVKDDVMVAFRTSNAFHKSLGNECSNF